MSSRDGRVVTKDVGSEVCMFLFRAKNFAYGGQVASTSECCRPDDVPARLSWTDLSKCQAAANDHPQERGFLPHVNAVRRQRNREAHSAASPAGPSTGAAGVCTPVSKTGGVRRTPSSPTLPSLTVEGGSVPVGLSVPVGRAPKSLKFSHS